MPTDDLWLEILLGIAPATNVAQKSGPQNPGTPVRQSSELQEEPQVSRASASHNVETQAGHEVLKAAAKSKSVKEKKRVFVSYCHRDRKWLEELQVTLRPMLREEEFLLWSDKQIQAGEKWRSEIEGALKSASIAILLVSRYFFASDFIAKNELPPLLDAAAKEGLRILWIALSASDYQRSPIAIYEALNDPGRPLDSLKPAVRNKELVRIGSTIHDLATR
jgi:hypothetical protein